MKKTIVMMLGLLVGFAMVSCAQKVEQSLDDLILEARKLNVETYTNALCNLLIERRPIPPDYKVHQLFLLRDKEEFSIILASGEDLDDVRVCSETNKAFGLMRIREKRGDRWREDIKSIVEMTLPLPDEPLSAVEIRTLVEMDDLETAEGRSWISEIEDVSPDGKTLLVRRAIPHKVNEHTTSWAHETFYMDVATGNFRKIGWE